jgi:hypothetical protein
MNTKDFAIGILSVTAIILLVGLLLLQAAPQPVLASGQSGTVGSFVVTTTHVDEQCELLCILDTGAQRLNVYQLEPTSNQLMPLRSIDVRAPANARDGGRQRRR